MKHLLAQGRSCTRFVIELQVQPTVLVDRQQENLNIAIHTSIPSMGLVAGKRPVESLDKLPFDVSIVPRHVRLALESEEIQDAVEDLLFSWVLTKDNELFAFGDDKVGSSCNDHTNTFRTCHKGKDQSNCFLLRRWCAVCCRENVCMVSFGGSLLDVLQNAVQVLGIFPFIMIFAIAVHEGDVVQFDHRFDPQHDRAKRG
jgi:hypothetical protein